MCLSVVEPVSVGRGGSHTSADGVATLSLSEFRPHRPHGASDVIFEAGCYSDCQMRGH
jgi:hypothetical protein